MTEAETINKLALISRKNVLNEDEAALYINRTVGAIRELRYKRRISFIRDGRKIQYRRMDLDKFINSHVVPTLN